MSSHNIQLQTSTLATQSTLDPPYHTNPEAVKRWRGRISPRFRQKLSCIVHLVIYRDDPLPLRATATIGLSCCFGSYSSSKAFGYRLNTLPAQRVVSLSPSLAVVARLLSYWQGSWLDDLWVYCKETGTIICHYGCINNVQYPSLAFQPESSS
jgi:hypothetical protein